MLINWYVKNNEDFVVRVNNFEINMIEGMQIRYRDYQVRNGRYVFMELEIF